MIELFPRGECWIGIGTTNPMTWEVGNGPVGARTHADEFCSPEEAIDYARQLGLRVTFEAHFCWYIDAETAALAERARDQREDLAVSAAQKR